MAENIPNIPTGPAGATPPPKKETGKVQPKKETVRINLPPKPSAAPTIKLPTLPPGGPTGAPSMSPPPASAAAPAAAPAPPRTGAAAPALQRTTTAPATQAPARTVPAATAPAAASLSPLDKILAIVAAVAGLAAVGTTVWLAFLF